MTYKKIRKLICRLIGHNDILVVTGRNRTSTWGWRICSRCDREDAFQYDQ